MCQATERRVVLTQGNGTTFEVIRWVDRPKGLELDEQTKKWTYRWGEKSWQQSTGAVGSSSHNSNSRVLGVFELGGDDWLEQLKAIELVIWSIMHHELCRALPCAEDEC